MSHFDEISEGPDSAKSVASQLFVYNCVIVASFVPLYYDYILTFSEEYERYWKAKRKFTLASMLFYVNRYLTTLGHIPVIFLYMGNWPHLDRLQISSPLLTTVIGTVNVRCLWINHYNEYIIVLIQIIVGVISIFRTYVLYGHKRWVLALLCSVTAGTIIYGMVSLLRLRAEPITLDVLTPSGCLLPVSLPMASGLAEAWSGHLLFDTLVFGLTLYKSLTTKRKGFTVISIMMRDGTIYFGMMILASVSVIVSFYIFPSYIRGLTATMTNTLSSTMISRLMLNLRNPELERHDEAGHISALVFNHDSRSAFSDESQYSEDEDELYEAPVRSSNHSISFETMKLPELYFDQNYIRDCWKSLGIDVREIV